MAELRLKQLTAENWQQPDSTLAAFVRFSGKDGSIRTLDGTDWAREILAVELSETAPLEVRRLFAVARGALVYGYFFYPLYTLGAEQLFRVADAAVGHKCHELGMAQAEVERLSFEKRLKHLVKEGIIATTAEDRWHPLRKLRNLTSHPRDQSILPPGIAIGELRRISADINALFES